MFIAKPNLNNTMGTAEFPTEKEAIEYLEKYTGIEMDFEVVRRKDKLVSKCVSLQLYSATDLL